MVIEAGSGISATLKDYDFQPIEAKVQAIASICLGTLLKTIGSIVRFRVMEELAIAALGILVKAGLGLKSGVANYEYSSSEAYMQAENFRLATQVDSALFEDIADEDHLDEEIQQPCDRCKANVGDMLVEDPIQGLWQGNISSWIAVAAKGRDEVNSNHSNIEKSHVGGKKEPEDDDDDDDDVDDDEDDDDNDDVESGDEGNDDGEEGEEDGNEDDDEEDEEEEEEDDEDEEEVAPSSVPGNVRAQNVQVEVEDDSDEGEEDEEGVEDEDDFEEGEDEEGDEDEDDEDDEDEEEIPEPPKKKNKST